MRITMETQLLGANIGILTANLAMTAMGIILRALDDDTERGEEDEVADDNY